MMHMEDIAFGRYTGYDTVLTEEAGNYHLLPPPHCLAIPVCATSNDSYRELVTKLGDWSLPEKVSELPTANHRVVKEILPHYTIIPVLKEKIYVKPVEVLSPMQEEAIREAKKKQQYISKRKPIKHVVGTLILD